MTEIDKILILFEQDPSFIFYDFNNKSNYYAGNYNRVFIVN